MVGSARNKVKPLKIALWSVLGVVLLFIFIVVGTLLVEKYIKKSSVPMFMGYSVLKVATGSMTGTIDQGDIIIVKKTDDYELGDIVTFINSKGEVITHRLVNYYDPDDKTVFITKGDYNHDTDQKTGQPPVSVDQIAGEVVLTIPKLGLFFDWLIHDFGAIYVLAIVAVIIAGVYFFKLTKDPEEQTENASEAKANTSTDVLKDAQSKEDAVQPKEDGSNDKNQQ